MTSPTRQTRPATFRLSRLWTAYGSVRALTNSMGTLIQAYRSDPFGVATATHGTSTLPFGFTREQADPTRLAYLRARAYDQQTGRLIQRDPVFGSITNPHSLHR